MIRVWFFHSCSPRPYLVLSALSSLGHHIPPSLFLGPVLWPLLIPYSSLIIYLFPFSGIWEPSLKGKGVMTTLASSGCTGALWGSGFPLPGLCPGVFMQRDESPWNEKVDLFQHCLGVGQGIFLSYYHLGIYCILEETNLITKLKVCSL